MQSLQCYSTGVKKCLFGHTFHLRPKKSFLVGGVGKGDFSVSLCPFSKKRLKIKTDKELDNIQNMYAQK